LRSSGSFGWRNENNVVLLLAPRKTNVKPSGVYTGSDERTIRGLALDSVNC